jgi:hypothetical protein
MISWWLLIGVSHEIASSSYPRLNPFQMIQLDNIKPTTASAIVMCLSNFFCVQLMIFLLNEDLFNRLDITRLIFVGVGITVPIILFAAMGVGATMRKDKKGEKLDAEALKIEREQNEKSLWSTSAGLAVMLVSFITLISYTFKFTLYRALWILFWVELALFFLIVIGLKKKPR